MLLPDILRVLVLISFGIPLLVFGVYGLIILYYGRRGSVKRQVDSWHESDKRFQPRVSIVIPTHNEELMISKRIENLLSLNYPKENLEIIFVDDSEDSTPDIILKYAKEIPNIKLVRFRERMGYSPAMIAGCKAAKSEIVVLADAGSFLDDNAIQNIVKNFQNPEIGVVTGKDVILNIDEETGKSEQLYQRIYDFLRTAESNMDSTFYVKGEATAVRRELITDLDNCHASFDTAVGLFARQKGYKSIFDPSVKFYEYAPSDHLQRVKQKVIRATNLISILFQFRSMAFRPKYGKFGLIVMPMNLAMLVVAPVAIIAGFVFLVLIAFFDFNFSIIILGIIGLILLVSTMLSKLLLLTFFEFEYGLIKALYLSIFMNRKYDKIEKIVSTRRVS